LENNRAREDILDKMEYKIERRKRDKESLALAIGHIGVD